MIGLEPIHLTIGNRGVKLGAPGVTRTLKHSILNRAAYTNSATGAWCWSRELNPDYQRFRPWRCTNSLLQQELGARPRSRTGRFYGLNVASLPIPLLGRNFWWVPQDLNLQCLRGDPFYRLARPSRIRLTPKNKFDCQRPWRKRWESDPRARLPCTNALAGRSPRRLGISSGAYEDQ